MSLVHESFTFPCEGDALVGIVSRSASPAARGVLIVVGGPQYRVGSHRQFKLLADALAEEGTPVMRFDYRGMGDSGGDPRDFEHVGADLKAAVDAFFARVESLKEVVVWGLCDAACAALFYAWSDARVSGLVLLNPWVRSPASEATAYLRHYYTRRALSLDSWRRLMMGTLDVRASAVSFLRHLRHALALAPSRHVAARAGDTSAFSLSERMALGLRRFKGPVLLILSGRDLTAREFTDVAASRPWRSLLAAPRVTRRTLPEATHTFSSREWRDQVARWTAIWVRSW